MRRLTLFVLLEERGFVEGIHPFPIVQVQSEKVSLQGRGGDRYCFIGVEQKASAKINKLTTRHLTTWSKEER